MFETISTVIAFLTPLSLFIAVVGPRDNESEITIFDRIGNQAETPTVTDDLDAIAAALAADTRQTVTVWVEEPSSLLTEI